MHKIAREAHALMTITAFLHFSIESCGQRKTLAAQVSEDFDNLVFVSLTFFWSRSTSLPVRVGTHLPAHGRLHQGNSEGLYAMSSWG
jgi:hypothetical protein